MKRPWEKYEQKLRETEGAYSDYAGWQKWLSVECEKRSCDGTWDGLSGMDELDKVTLYSLMVDLCDKEPTP